MAEISSYKVGVTRSHKPGPSRWLTLKLKTPEHGAHSLTLFFYDKEPPSFGYFNKESSCVVVNLPAADFASSYEILKTEKPVFAFFRIDANQHRLLSLDLSTSEEPPGEGPTDTSP